MLSYAMGRWLGEQSLTVETQVLGLIGLFVAIHFKEEGKLEMYFMSNLFTTSQEDQHDQRLCQQQLLARRKVGRDE